jgi:hypothetical protein
MIEILPTAIDSRIVPLGILAAAVVATAMYGTRRRLGPNADWLETIRGLALPVIDPVLERVVGGAGAKYELTDAEHAGHLTATPETVEQRLWDKGCRRNPVAAFKTIDDGREEVGSWVYRGEDVDERRQVHVMLFRTPDGGTDVFAHEEYSSALGWLVRDPRVLRKHYRAVDYDPAAGVKWAQSRFKSTVPSE